MTNLSKHNKHGCCYNQNRKGLSMAYTPIGFCWIWGVCVGICSEVCIGWPPRLRREITTGARVVLFGQLWWLLRDTCEVWHLHLPGWCHPEPNPGMKCTASRVSWMESLNTIVIEGWNLWFKILNRVHLAWNLQGDAKWETHHKNGILGNCTLNQYTITIHNKFA